MATGEAPSKEYAAKPADSIDLSEFSGIAKTALITGRHGTGKTTLLLDRIQALLESGADPEGILVVCASALSEQDFKLALSKRCSECKVLPQVLNTRRLARDILAESEAEAQTGRHPRLLAEFEYSILLHDLKTTGIKPKRLKEILKFFYKSWTELADEDPHWLVTNEERNLHALLKDELVLLRCMLEPELAATAVKWLKLSPRDSGKGRYAQVFVDDYHLLSRASQLLVHLLAIESLTVTGTTESPLEVFESFPYKAGLDEFLLINPDAEQIDLAESYQSETIIRVRNALLNEEVFSTLPELRPATGAVQLPGKIIVEPSLTPEDEFIAIASHVKALLAAGTEPGDVAITAFNRSWARHIAEILRENGIPVELHYDHMSLGGDTRDLDKSLALRVYTALRLVADPDDATSWRCWCGFGDYLGNSAALAALHEQTASQESAITLDADTGDLRALLQSMALREDPDPGVKRVLALYREGNALVDACQGLRGSDALEQIVLWLTEGETSILPAVLQMPGWDADGLSCSQLVSLYEQRMTFPQLDDPTGSVLVTSPSFLSGKHFKTLLVCGFVNGFIPPRGYFDLVETSPEQQTKIRNRCLHMIALILGCTSETLVLTYFEKIDLASAERLNLSIKRIRAEKGQRVCTILPSELLELIVLVVQ
ncbi:MAG: hypothetical protein LBS98_03255 [Coriobacteriales bacterium]|jgi:hypothetical protein|nr:hypothetical protein [Coriobacteriales bacterium]